MPPQAKGVNKVPLYLPLAKRMPMPLHFLMVLPFPSPHACAKEDEWYALHGRPGTDLSSFESVAQTHFHLLLDDPATTPATKGLPILPPCPRLCSCPCLVGDLSLGTLSPTHSFRKAALLNVDRRLRYPRGYSWRAERFFPTHCLPSPLPSCLLRLILHPQPSGRTNFSLSCVPSSGRTYCC